MILNSGLKILSFFTSDYSRSVYGWQIAKEFKMNQKTVSTILKTLEKENILKFKTEGKNKYYYLNTSNREVWSFLVTTEVYKKLLFLEHFKKLKEFFYELERLSDGILVIFGSYASFTNTHLSDIDVFVCGSIKETSKLEKTYNMKINVKKANTEQFVSALRARDHLINEIISNHIILRGYEDFIRLARDNYDFNKMVF